MYYLNIGLDSAVSIFDICQAHVQLESDYNKGGIVIERPSNRRRNESTGCQLSRMQYLDVYRWVDICTDAPENNDSGDDDVRNIYLQNVLKWGLPIDAQMMAKIKTFFTSEFWGRFPQTAGLDYLQGH